MGKRWNRLYLVNCNSLNVILNCSPKLLPGLENYTVELQWLEQLWNHDFGWLDGLGFNSPLRQYFSLYRAVSQREGERGKRIDESKNVQTTPTRTYCKCSRPLPYCNPNCRTPRHWKLTQHHRTTRPPPWNHEKMFKTGVVRVNER